MTVSIGIANIYIPLMSMLILSYEWNIEFFIILFRPWRLLLIIFTLPGVIALIWLYKFPESPQFLNVNGKGNDAIMALKWINKVNNGNAVDELNNSKISNVMKTSDSSIFTALISQTKPLLKLTLLTPLALCSFLHFGTFAISNGIGVFVPEFLLKIEQKNDDQFCNLMKTEISSNSSMESLECSDSIDTNVFINTSFLGIFYTIAFILLAIIVKFVNRRYVLSFNILSSAIGGFLFTYLHQSWTIILFYFIFVVQSGINISLINSILCDVIPAKFRTMAICLAMTFGRLGSVITSNFIGVFIETHCQILFNSLTIVLFLCFLFSFYKV